MGATSSRRQRDKVAREAREHDELRRAYRRRDLPFVIAEPHSKTDATFVGIYAASPYPKAAEQPWRVEGVLTPGKDGQLVLSQLSVKHFNDSTVEVTAYALRRLPAATVRDQALEWLRNKHKSIELLVASGGAFGASYTKAERDRARRVALAAARPLRRGRAGYPVEHYWRIADRAVELFGEGRRDVINALAEEEGRPYQTVRDWIRRARKDFGFLEPVKQGRTNFRPGPNLYKKGASDG